MLAGYDSLYTQGSPVVFHAEPTPDRGFVLGFKQTINDVQAVRLIKFIDGGVIDQDFGDNGIVTSLTLGELRSVLVRADGGIVLVGKNRGAVFPDSLSISLESYTATGVLDEDFGVGGRIVHKPPGALDQYVDDAILGPDGKILVGGSQWTGRFDVNGTLDMSFGNAGWYPFPGRKIRLTPQGKIRSLGIGMTEFDYTGSVAPNTFHYSYCYPSSSIECLQDIHEISCDGNSAGFADFHNQGFPGEGWSSGYSAVSGVYTTLSGATTASVLWRQTVSQDFSYDEYYAGYVSDIVADPYGDFYICMGWTGTDQPSGVPHGWVIKKKFATGYFHDETFGQYPVLYVYHGVISSFDGVAPTSRSAFMQPDGKLVVAGTIGDSLYVARYHASPDPRSSLSLRMFLGGAYDVTTGLMRDDLRIFGLLPAVQPYGIPFFSAAHGVGPWAAPAHVLAVEGETAVVDWVWLELLNSADSSNVVATRVGLVHRNGWVTSADGHSPIDFSAGAGSYFVRARHRNHLSATASQAITLGPSVSTLDLTDPATPTFGTDAQMEVNGVRMLWPGEARYDGVVKYFGTNNDRDKLLQTVGGTTPTNTLGGYLAEDLNLDGWVKYTGMNNDRDVILQVVGGAQPTAVRFEQVP